MNRVLVLALVVLTGALIVLEIGAKRPPKPSRRPTRQPESYHSNMTINNNSTGGTSIVIEQNRLSQLIAEMDSPEWGSSSRQGCSTEFVFVCCRGDFIVDPVQRQGPVPETCPDMQVKRCCSKRDLAMRVGIIDKLVTCLTELVANVMGLRPQVPESCCQIPFLRFLCKFKKLPSENYDHREIESGYTDDYDN